MTKPKFFVPSQFGPRIRTEGSIVVQKRKSLFGAVLSRITSPFSTVAKSSAARVLYIIVLLVGLQWHVHVK